jgi:hypothetical protein
MNLGAPAGPFRAAILEGFVMKILSLSTLAVLAASTLSLQAETPRYGVQGLVNIPLGDLKTYVDNNPGIGIGVQGTFDLGDGHMLRPRLDYGLYQQVNLATAKQKASFLSLGGDYLYFIAGKPEGLYFTAGLSAVRWTFQYEDPSKNLTNDTTKFGISAGIGYQWNYNLGTEVRWLHSSVSSGFKADSLQAAVTFRF